MAQIGKFKTDSFEAAHIYIMTHIRSWVFKFKSPEEAQQALKAIESWKSPNLGLGMANFITMESNSPEPTSGSASGTNRAFFGRL